MARSSLPLRTVPKPSAAIVHNEKIPASSSFASTADSTPTGQPTHASVDFTSFGDMRRRRTIGCDSGREKDRSSSNSIAGGSGSSSNNNSSRWSNISSPRISSAMPGRGIRREQTNGAKSRYPGSAHDSALSGRSTPSLAVSYSQYVHSRHRAATPTPSNGRPPSPMRQKAPKATSRQDSSPRRELKSILKNTKRMKDNPLSETSDFWDKCNLDMVRSPLSTTPISSTSSPTSPKHQYACTPMDNSNLSSLSFPSLYDYELRSLSKPPTPHRHLLRGVHSRAAVCDKTTGSDSSTHHHAQPESPVSDDQILSRCSYKLTSDILHSSSEPTGAKRVTFQCP